MITRLTIAVSLVITACASLAADLPELVYTGEAPRIQTALSPEDSQKHVQTPDGFKAVLFASEPEIVNPIALSWDSDGRLFVLQSVDYPHKFGKPEGGDRITICEDTNRDGKADTFTVFAENLSIATGMVCVDGGVIVAMAPDMKFLEDTDGDDKVDKTTVLFSGFGLHDTHAGPSNLMLGLDNHVWGSVGYSGFSGLFKGGKRSARMGVYRFSRDGSFFEFVGGFNNNTWGSGMTESFDLFGSTANNNHCVYIGIPKRFSSEKKFLNVKNIQGHYDIAKVCKDPLQQVDVRNGYTAAAGANIYTARTYPKEYWSRVMLVNEPTGHVVHRAILQEDGAGFKEVDGGNLFASSDNWSAPVYSAVGPDGHVWVADWYNLVIQHNPDRRGMSNQVWNAKKGLGNAHLNELRDKSHGRIYQVVYEKAKTKKHPTLKKAKTKKLVAALTHENMFWRNTAQHLIVSRELTDAIPRLIKLVGNKDVDETGLSAAPVHAIWALKGLGALDGANKSANRAVYDALAHPSAAVRKAAAQALPETEEGSLALASSTVLTDENMHTRLAATLRATELPKVGALNEAITKAKTVGVRDEWITVALKLAAGDSTPVKPAKVDAPARKKADVVVTLKTIKEKMSYDKTLIKVKSGQTVEIRFVNDDVMPHNVVLLTPGKLDDFGAATDAFLTDKSAEKKGYVPPSKRVLSATPIIAPGKQASIFFTAPATAGKFPYVCTFPGHWRLMNGILEVSDGKSLTLNESGKTKVLITGGGGSHDFLRWFGEADGKVFATSGARVDYTENTKTVSDQLAEANLLVISNNKPFSSDWKTGIIDHTNKGKSLLIIHPGVWYNWKDWPEYNKQLVGGGSRNHERLGAFDIIVKKPEHPLMKGVPAKFEITDELYRWTHAEGGADVEVLAIGKGRKSGDEFPVVWVVKHPTAKIVGNSLGHDERAHTLPAYKTILRNTLEWCTK